MTLSFKKQTLMQNTLLLYIPSIEGVYLPQTKLMGFILFYIHVAEGASGGVQCHHG